MGDVSLAFFKFKRFVFISKPLIFVCISAFPLSVSRYAIIFLTEVLLVISIFFINADASQNKKNRFN